jgi:hypothetical protein
VETSNLRFKQGDIRSDGMVFWQYYHTGKERWVYPEKYQEIKQRRIEKCKKRWQEKYKEKYKEKCKEYRKQNKEKLSLYLKEWRSKNQEKCRHLKNSWREKNRDRFRKTSRDYVRNKRSSDPIYKIRCNISTLIQNGIRNRGFSKKTKTSKILGCDYDFFKKYIESKFKEGMTWESRSEWSLDHIIPISLAKTEEELIKLNHYTNFQPLWKIENIKKGNKLPTQFCRHDT